MSTSFSIWIITIVLAIIVAVIGRKILALKISVWLVSSVSVLGALSVSLYILSYDTDNLAGVVVYTLLFVIIVLIIIKSSSVFIEKQKQGGSMPYKANLQKSHKENEALNKTATVKSKSGTTTDESVLQVDPVLSKDEIFKLKDLIAQNDVNSVIGELKGRLRALSISPNLYDEIVILESRLNQIEASVRKGIISLNEQVLEINKVRDNLLDLINQLQS